MVKKKLYCWIEYELCDIDDPDACGLSDSRGTNCVFDGTVNAVIVTRGTFVSDIGWAFNDDWYLAKTLSFVDFVDE